MKHNKKLGSCQDPPPPLCKKILIYHDTLTTIHIGKKNIFDIYIHDILTIHDIYV